MRSTWNRKIRGKHVANIFPEINKQFDNWHFSMRGKRSYFISTLMYVRYTQDALSIIYFLAPCEHRFFRLKERLIFRLARKREGPHVRSYRPYFPATALIKRFAQSLYNWANAYTPSATRVDDTLNALFLKYHGVQRSYVRALREFKAAWAIKDSLS